MWWYLLCLGCGSSPGADDPDNGGNGEATADSSPSDATGTSGHTGLAPTGAAESTGSTGASALTGETAHTGSTAHTGPTADTAGPVGPSTLDSIEFSNGICHLGYSQVCEYVFTPVGDDVLVTGYGQWNPFFDPKAPLVVEQVGVLVGTGPSDLASYMLALEGETLLTAYGMGGGYESGPTTVFMTRLGVVTAHQWWSTASLIDGGAPQALIDLDGLIGEILGGQLTCQAMPRFEPDPSCVPFF